MHAAVDNAESQETHSCKKLESDDTSEKLPDTRNEFGRAFKDTEELYYTNIKCKVRSQVDKILKGT